MRAEIQRLANLDGVDLDRADHVKAALERGVDALRALSESRGTGWLAPWVASAAAAVGSLDPATPLGLQRAEVQDALRALADAVLVLEQFDR